MNGRQRLLAAAVVWAVVSNGVSVLAQNVTFIPLGRDVDNSEAEPGIWFRPDLGTAQDVLPLKTRAWATKESVTGGVALKCAFDKGSKAVMAMEMSALPKGSAGITFYAKASKALKITVCNVPCDVGADWKKIDLAWEKFGTTKDAPNIGWQFVVKAVGPVTEKTWLIIDRLGIETPSFDPNPKIDPQPGPDTVLSSKDMLYGVENLAKTAALLKEKKPFKVIALGDSVTAGAQITRGSWGIKPADCVQFLYFSHLTRLLEESAGYKGITPVQRGHGGWQASQGLTVVDKEVVADASAGDLVILEFGANDMGWAGVTPAAWKANMKKLIERVKTKTDQIIVMSPTVGGSVPKQAAEITEMLKQIVAEEKVAGADITKLSMYRGEPFAWALLANQFHPDIMGHITVAEMMAPLLTGQPRNYPE